MSNNKQIMKLYTEEQVIDIFEKYGNMSAITARNILDLSECIKLPSDEELSEEGQKQWGNVHSVGVVGWLDGSKWMRDKIQGGNNEQQ